MNAQRHVANRLVWKNNFAFAASLRFTRHNNFWGLEFWPPTLHTHFAIGDFDDCAERILKQRLPVCATGRNRSDVAENSVVFADRNVREDVFWFVEFAKWVCLGAGDHGGGAAVNSCRYLVIVNRQFA